MKPSFTFFLLLFSAAMLAAADEYVAVDYQHTAIYHSPQTPGYTCWVSACAMPDGGLLVGFTQATGPVEGRARAPKPICDKLGWPPPGRPLYDMTGLDLRNVYLRSTDAGATWVQVGTDAFQSCMNGVAESATVLPDGSILRGMEGYYLPYNPELPQTGYLQRSTDGAKTWGKPEVLLDPAKESVWPKRIRGLRDGRVIIVGGLARVPANSRTREEYCKLFEPLLLVSKDNGRTWSEPISVVPEKYRGNWGGEECDAAELPNGDLLFVFRRMVPELGAEARWQGVCPISGDSWGVADVQPAPFPHSGHPELLATREGPVLHVASSGIHCTEDAGKTWRKLDVPGSQYYPRAVQLLGGRIFVFAHVGSDNAYGSVDQSIVMDSFCLEKN